MVNTLQGWDIDLIKSFWILPISNSSEMATCPPLCLTPPCGRYQASRVQESHFQALHLTPRWQGNTNTHINI